MAKLTRQEMKRDEFLETASRLYEFISSHTRSLIFAAIGLAAVALAAAAVFAFLAGRQERANALFARALAAYSADVVGDGADPQDPFEPTFATNEERDTRAEELLREVEESYGRSSVGKIAGVYLGRLAARAGNEAEARERWERFLAVGDDTMLMTEVRLNLLALDRDDGRTEEIVSLLQDSIASERPNLPLEVALDELAVTLERSGREEEARTYYQQIVDEYPSSPYAVRARQKLQEL
jgi:tetratricopeptide (TPR) repeat protein